MTATHSQHQGIELVAIESYQVFMITPFEIDA
jgi:hypothetical protein